MLGDACGFFRVAAVEGMEGALFVLLLKKVAGGLVDGPIPFHMVSSHSLFSELKYYILLHGGNVPRPVDEARSVLSCVIALRVDD